MEQKYKLHTYSYMGLRKSVGWIGVLLPAVLVVGTNIIGDVPGIGQSISAYYESRMGDVFVGAMCAVGLFMFFYAGYEPLDNWTGNAAAICAIAVALFPAVGDFPPWVRTVHLVSATLFFLTLTFFSLFLFTRGVAPEKRTVRKRFRNRVYVACGIVMVGALVVIAIHFQVRTPNDQSSLIFWGETVALIAFGISWLTKGEAIFPDRKE